MVGLSMVKHLSVLDVAKHGLCFTIGHKFYAILEPPVVKFELFVSCGAVCREPG